MTNVNALLKMHKADGEATKIAEVFRFSFFLNKLSYISL